MSEVKHTPGPWRWEVNRKHQSVNLCGGLPAGTFDKTVLGFGRYGMNGAAPIFHNWTKDGWGGAPKRADKLAVEAPGRDHHSDWFALIDHPNAHLIAAAPELLEAAKEVYEWMNNLPIPTHGCVSKMKTIYDAIAKAEGRS